MKHLKHGIKCHVCGSIQVEIRLKDKEKHDRDKHWPYIYYCLECHSLVGCHKHTLIPLGKLADAFTRFLRMKAHREFDKIWKLKLLTRDEAYEWLSKQLNINYKKCHISHFTNSQLETTINLAFEFIRDNWNIITRRKEKQNAKQRKQQRRNESEERRKFKLIQREKRKRRKS